MAPIFDIFIPITLLDERNSDLQKFWSGRKWFSTYRNLKVTKITFSGKMRPCVFCFADSPLVLNGIKNHTHSHGKKWVLKCLKLIQLYELWKDKEKLLGQPVGVGHGISVIERTGDFLHGTPRALSISRKNGVVRSGRKWRHFSVRAAMTKSWRGFADPLTRVDCGLGELWVC